VAWVPAAKTSTEAAELAGDSIVRIVKKNFHSRARFFIAVGCNNP
jgi:hypothetical protein